MSARLMVSSLLFGLCLQLGIVHTAGEEPVTIPGNLEQIVAAVQVVQTGLTKVSDDTVIWHYRQIGDTKHMIEGKRFRQLLIEAGLFNGLTPDQGYWILALVDENDQVLAIVDRFADSDVFAIKEADCALGEIDLTFQRGQERWRGWYRSREIATILAEAVTVLDPGRLR